MILIRKAGQNVFERHGLKKFFLICLVWWCSPIFSAPPFITDDADPADFHQLNLYLFSTLNVSRDFTYYSIPAVEADYGIIPNLEFHVIGTVSHSITHSQIANASGIGDTEVNIKYRFITETSQRPELAIVPTVELPTGNVRRNLGNGRAWYKLPIWIEKNWGPWRTYGGGGYGVNSAPGMENFFFGGWLLQRTLTDQLALGGEIYSQTGVSSLHPPFQDNSALTLLNIGGSYNLNKSTAALLSVGHSLIGLPQWIGYLGLTWTIDG